MKRIILVRAVNVGGCKLPMAEFREIAESLGATEVATYIASGNMVAEVPGDPDAFDRSLESALTDRFGWSREVISRSPDELVAALAAHPFEIAEPKFSYVAFMLAAPTAAAIEAARAVPTGEDRWEVIGRDLHIRYAHGAGRAELKDPQLHRALGRIPTTARNLLTVRKLIELSAQGDTP